MNFADQRRAAAKRAAQLGATSDGPSLARGYDATGTSYMGEVGSQTLDIIDSGGPNKKGTIVNKPNAAYSHEGYNDDLQKIALKGKKSGH